jgi:hypothetical protein
MGHDEHFLERLDRVASDHMALALGLYRDHELVRYILTHLRLPEAAERIAIALEDGGFGPHVVVARDGGFVTCLGPGMSTETVRRPCPSSRGLTSRGLSRRWSGCVRGWRLRGSGASTRRGSWHASNPRARPWREKTSSRPRRCSGPRFLFSPASTRPGRRRSTRSIR